MNNEIKVHILHTGTVIIDEALPFNRPEHPFYAWSGIFRSKKHLVEAPVSVYLIEHPKGLVLIDTGWHTDNRDKQFRNVRHQYFTNKAKLPVGEAVNEQIERLGYKVSDIDYVVMSHLHCDHADGLRLVKDAKKIMVSKEELAASRKDKVRYLPHEWKGVELETFEFENSGLGPVGKSFDLFGDGTVQFILAPGHSKGLSMTKIENNGKFIVLTSDVAYGRPSIEESLEPSVVVNRKQAKKSLAWLIDYINNENCVGVYANHDTEVKPQVITL